jgi:hypothetical protein
LTVSDRCQPVSSTIGVDYIAFRRVSRKFAGNGHKNWIRLHKLERLCLMFVSINATSAMCSAGAIARSNWFCGQ